MNNPNTNSPDRFSLLELDLPGEESGPSVSAETAAPEEVPGKTVRASAAEKAKSERELAEKSGFGTPGIFFAEGTKMLKEGEEEAKRLRAEWETRPLVSEGAEALCDRIKSEQRKDYVVPAKDFRIDEDGLLTRGQGGLELTEHAFKQLAGFAPDETKNRYNVNEWLGRKRSNLRLRTRNPNREKGTREGFAVVSEKYAPVDLDTIAKLAAKELPSDARMEALYDAPTTRAKLDISLANPYEIQEEIGVGRMHRVGARILTADDGSSSIKVKLFAERIACINCTIMRDERLTFSRRHVGDEAEIKELVRQALASADSAMKGFANLWSEANRKAIVDRYEGTPLSAEETFKRLIATDRINVPWVKPNELLERLMDAWNREPGNPEEVAAAHVNRAVTRMAHEQAADWKSPWYQEELEETAGKLLYARVYSLPALTEEQEELFQG